jgi:hypothetical protein
LIGGLFRSDPRARSNHLGNLRMYKGIPLLVLDSARPKSLLQKAGEPIPGTGAGHSSKLRSSNIGLAPSCLAIRDVPCYATETPVSGILSPGIPYCTYCMYSTVRACTLITSPAQHLICRRASILRILPFSRSRHGLVLPCMRSRSRSVRGNGGRGERHALEQPNLYA